MFSESGARSIDVFGFRSSMFSIRDDHANTLPRQCSSGGSKRSDSTTAAGTSCASSAALRGNSTAPENASKKTTMTHPKRSIATEPNENAALPTTLIRRSKKRCRRQGTVCQQGARHELPGSSRQLHVLKYGDTPLTYFNRGRRKSVRQHGRKKKSRSSASVFRHRFLAVGFGETAAERGRTKPRPPQKNARVVFFSVRNR